MKAKEEVRSIEIPAPNVQLVNVKIRGKSPLVMHQWSEKARGQLADNGGPKKKKEPRDPAEAFMGSIWWVSDRPEKNDTKLPKGARVGIPGSAFKKAIVSATRNLNDKSIPMTLVRQSIFVLGEVIEIEFDTCNMREDIVRVSNGAPDMRWRPEFPTWSCTVPIEFDANVFQAGDVINLLNLAGNYVGLLEGRPEKQSGLGWGRFEVAA